MKNPSASRVALFCGVMAWLGCFDSGAQGLVNFATKVTGSVDARVMLSDGAPAASAYLGQLYAGTLALGEPVPFRESPTVAQGYITAGGTLAVPGVSPLDRADLRLVAWHGAYGTSFEEARTRSASLGGVGVGESAVVTVLLGGGVIPPLNLIGLQGFTVAAVTPETVALLHELYGVPGAGGISIPEPSTALLALVGAGILMRRRRDRR